MKFRKTKTKQEIKKMKTQFGGTWFDWPWWVKNNQSDFYMALANQEQHADLDPPENRKNSNTRFIRPWRW